MLNVRNVLNGELVPVMPSEPDQPEVREDVPLPRWQDATPAPEQTFPRLRNVHRDYLEKFTFGTCFASAGASNNGYSLKPNNLAVRLPGNCRRAVLYSWIFSL